MNITTIRQGLAAAASTIPDLTALAYHPESISDPCFHVVAVNDVVFHRAMRRGLDRITMTCRVLVQGTDDESSQRALDAYLAGSGDQSLRAAVEGTRGTAEGGLSLGGACHDVWVTSVQNYQKYAYGEDEYMGAELNIEVSGRGDM